MKIAFVSQPWTRFPQGQVQHSDSIAIWTHEVAARLCAHHEVAIYSRRLPSDTRSGSASSHAACPEHRKLPLMGEQLWRRAVRPILRRLGIPSPAFDSDWYHAFFAASAARDVAQHGADVIHVHNFSHFLPLLRACNPRARIVLHMHCEWLAQMERGRVATHLKDADVILGCSDHITNLAVQRFPELASRCFTVPNGVELPGEVPSRRSVRAHNRQSRAREILFVGRLTPEKGVHDLVTAFTAVAARFADASLTLLGPVATTPRAFLVDASRDPAVRALATYYQGDYGELLRALVPTGLRNRVHFVGEVDRARLSEHYEQAAVLANPSYSESFGMTVVEAMAAGIPVVAGAVGGMLETVTDGRVGYLVPPGDPVQLAEALIRVLADPRRANRMGSEGRKRAKLYSWDEVARRTQRCYEGSVT